MAVLTGTDFIQAVQNYVGNDNSDEGVKFFSDMLDTYDALTKSSQAERVAELENQLKATNDTWAARYNERFRAGIIGIADSRKSEQQQAAEDRAASIGFSDLFG